MKNNKGFVGLSTILIIIIAILIVGSGAYYLGVKNNSILNNIEKNNSSQKNQDTLNDTKNSLVPSDWKTFVYNDIDAATGIGFEFRYPSYISSDMLPGFRGVVIDYGVNPITGIVKNPENLDNSAKIEIKRHTINGNPGIVSSTKIDGNDARIICDYIDGSCTVTILLSKPVSLFKNSKATQFQILVIPETYFPHKYIDQILSTFKFTK